MVSFVFSLLFHSLSLPFTDFKIRTLVLTIRILLPVLLLLILFISRFDMQFAMTTALLQLFFLTCASAFVHPGLLVNEVDITRIKTKLDAQRDPWLSSWNDLISLEYSSASYTNNAVPVVYRDDEGTNTANAQLLWHDAAAAFNLGLRWKVSGETQYAEAAAKILTAWGENLPHWVTLMTTISLLASKATSWLTRPSSSGTMLHSPGTA